MPVNTLADRLARIRVRFMTSIESKIEHAFADLPKLSGESRNAALVETYRRIHGIVGVGPTVGFPATSKAAKAVENVLLGPYDKSRGLVPDEMASLTKALHALRETARQELQTTYTNWR